VRENHGVDERMVERVLIATELIPRGSIASYGDLGALVGTGPRHVGAIMSMFGQGVPWWRVTNASGDFPPHLREQARPHWAQEGIAWKPNARGCRITEFRTDLIALGREFDAQWQVARRDARQ